MDTPLDKVVERRRVRPWSPLVLGVLTLVLTLYLAFQSSELHVAERVLREHDALLNEQPHYKLYQAWKKVRFEGVLGNGGPAMDEFQKLMDAARDLSDRRSALLLQLRDVAQLRLVPPLPDWLSPLGWISSATAAPAEAPADGKAVPVADDVCSEPAQPPAPKAGKLAPLTMLQVSAARERELACFVQTQQIDPDSVSHPMWLPVYDTRDKVNLLVSWLLPGVYGLLGACFYLMRRMLQPDSVRPLRSGKAIAAVDILLRLAAGGLAGIIIGWFWVPAAASAPINAVPSLSFGIAFLAGFSTDALFSLLDKLLKGLSPPDKQAPA